jgi:hypothetical protein
MLHERVLKNAGQNGRKKPENTSAIYTSAMEDEPDLLDQLLLVHHRAREENGGTAPGSQPMPVDDAERKKMLSAVRAMVHQSSVRFSE